MSEWISVLDKLPSEHGAVLVTVRNFLRDEGAYTIISHYDEFDGGFEFWDNIEDSVVTHWMNLPKADIPNMEEFNESNKMFPTLK